MANELTEILAECTEALLGGHSFTYRGRERAVRDKKGYVVYRSELLVFNSISLPSGTWVSLYPAGGHQRVLTMKAAIKRISRDLHARKKSSHL